MNDIQDRDSNTQKQSSGRSTSKRPGNPGNPGNVLEFFCNSVGLCINKILRLMSFLSVLFASV